jgi:hypothetical protein
MAVGADDLTARNFGKQPLRAVGTHQGGHLSGLPLDVVEVHHMWREGPATVGAGLALELVDKP